MASALCSRRWLNLGFTRVQVSEFAKLALVFSLAHYLALNQSRLHDFWRWEGQGMLRRSIRQESCR